MSWQPGGDAFNPTPAPVAADRGERARAALAGEAAPPLLQTAPTPAKEPQSAKPTNPFHMEVKAVGKDGRKFARAEPIVPGLNNQFHDDGKVEAKASMVRNRKGKLINFDKVVAGAVARTPREREPVKNQRVSVTCSKCNQKYEVEAFEARPELADEDSDQMRNVCTSCMAAAVSRRF